MAIDNLSITVEGCRYLGNSWVDNPVDLLFTVNTALQEVTNLNFDKVAAVANRIGSFGLSAISCSYGGTSKKYLSQVEIGGLKDDISSALLGVSNFIFDIVSISCSRNDEAAGVV